MVQSLGQEHLFPGAGTEPVAKALIGYSWNFWRWNHANQKRNGENTKGLNHHSIPGNGRDDYSI